MPFTVMTPDTSNIPALFGLQRVQLKNLRPDTSLINKFVKLTLHKDWGVKWVGTVPRRKVVLLEAGPLDDQKINAYLIGQYAKDFDAVNVGDDVFVSNVMIQKSVTFSKDLIHPCQLVLSSESKPDVWIIPSKAASSSGTTQDNRATGDDAATRNGGTLHQDRQSALFKDLYNYRYTPLKEVKATRSVDVYGVVKFFKPPYKTSGADYCMMVTIVDPSIDAQASGLKCLIFNADIDLMPEVLDVGDVVRFHRLKVIVFRDELQGQKSPGFSCLVFDGSPEAPVEARSTTRNYTLSELDKEKVRELRTWSRQCGFLSERSKLTLSEVTVGQHFDLICQVIASSPSPQDGCFHLKVWDGTKCKLSNFIIDDYQLDEAMKSEVDRVGELAVDIFVNGQHTQCARSLSPGDFVRFYNLYTSYDSGQHGLVNGRSKVIFVLHDGTQHGRGMVRLNKTNSEVRQLLRKLETAVEDAALVEEANDTTGCAPASNVRVSNQDPPGVVPDASDSMTLSKVRVGQYFDLTCQVIKTIEMNDASCVCINVWDGTKMNLLCRKMDYSNYSVSMIPGLADAAGPMAEDVCLYDNHMENGRKIKPGDFVKVTNLHAPRYPPVKKGASLPPMGTAMKVELVLHKGDTFGKNVEVLPPDSPSVAPLRRRLDAIRGKPSPERTTTGKGRNTARDGNRNQTKNNSAVTSQDGEASIVASGTGGNDVNVEENRNGKSKRSDDLRCMQRFASFTVNCERIKFVSISEAKDIVLPNKFRIRARLKSYRPDDVRDFVHVHCLSCNYRCGLSFLRDVSRQRVNDPDRGADVTRRHSPRLRKFREKKDATSKVEDLKRSVELRASERIRAQQQQQRRLGQPGINYREVNSSQESNVSESGRTKRKQSPDPRESPTSEPKRTLPSSSPRRSPKRTKRGETPPDSQSSDDYETASQGSSLANQRVETRSHQRLKIVEVEGKHGTVEVKNVSANDVIRLCQNGLKLSQPPKVCLKFVPHTSPESGVRLLCPRCCPDVHNGCRVMMDYEYLFKLLVVDDSDSLEVIVQGNQATTFLNGLEPDNLYKDNTLRDKLARIMEVLHPSRDPDTTAATARHLELECCVKGHTVIRHGRERRIYQLVDTLLSKDVTEV